MKRVRYLFSLSWYLFREKKFFPFHQWLPYSLPCPPSVSWFSSRKNTQKQRGPIWSKCEPLHYLPWGLCSPVPCPSCRPADFMCHTHSHMPPPQALACSAFPHWIAPMAMDGAEESHWRSDSPTDPESKYLLNWYPLVPRTKSFLNLKRLWSRIPLRCSER